MKQRKEMRKMLGDLGNGKAILEFEDWRENQGITGWTLQSLETS